MTGSLTFLLPVPRWAADNADLPSNSSISKAVTVAQRLMNQDLRKLREITKTSKLHRIITQCSVFPQTKSFFDTSRKLLKSRNYSFPVLRYFTLKLQFLPYIFFHNCRYRYLKVVELLKSQKLSFPIFPILKGLTQMQFIKSYIYTENTIYQI